MIVFKKFFAYKSPYTPSQLNFVTISVSLQPLTQFQITIRASELQKGACLITTFSQILIVKMVYTSCQTTEFPNKLGF